MRRLCCVLCPALLLTLPCLPGALVKEKASPPSRAIIVPSFISKSGASRRVQSSPVHQVKSSQVNFDPSAQQRCVDELSPVLSLSRALYKTSHHRRYCLKSSSIQSSRALTVQPLHCVHAILGVGQKSKILLHCPAGRGEKRLRNF